MPLSFGFAADAQEELDALQVQHGFFVGEVIAQIAEWCASGHPPSPGRPYGRGQLVPIHNGLPVGQAVVLVYADARKVVVLAAGTWKTPAQFTALEALAIRRI